MKNYHTHTYRCHHASGNDEDYVLQAIRAGIDELGFSDHTPWKYSSAFHPFMRMEEYQLKGYVQSIRRLKEKYKDQISIKIGLEVEYFKQYIPWLKEMIDLYDIDYLILGNHYDGSDEYGIYYGSYVNKDYLKKYVDQVIEGINTGLFSYVAHPDLINYDIHDPCYRQEMTRLAKEAKKLDIPLEYNLLGLEGKRNYPNHIFFEIVKEVGNKVIIGFDAHKPSMLANKTYYNQALQYLKSLGIEITEEIKFLK